MRFSFAALFVFALGAHASDLSIACTGAFAPAATEQTLIEKFGRKNVVRDDVYVAEGATEPGTILFPNDPSRRIEIVWRDAKRRRGPEWMRIPSESGWMFAGLRTGMRIADVETLNGKAFKLHGFDWDYGGNVTDWRGGRLAKAVGRCTAQVRFDREVPEQLTARDEKALANTSGDREVLSSSPQLRRFTTSVSEIVIAYPR